MRAAVRYVARRVGRRGAVLILLGVIALLYGVSLITTPPPPPVPGLHLLLGVMSLHRWGVVLATSGAIAIASAPLPSGRDWPGFAGLVLVWLPWSASFFVSWWPDGSNPRGWVSGVVFLAFAGVPAVCAKWEEPTQSGRHLERARSTR